MEKRNEHVILQIFIQVLLSLFLGVIIFGPSVITPSNSFFVFSLYSFSAIIFYYLINKYGMNALLLFGTLLSIILISVFKPDFDLAVLLRNISWYFLNGLLAACINKTEKGRSRFFVMAAWFTGFMIIYIIMAFLNVYIFNLYKTNNNFSILFYIQQAIKVGGVLGFAIGFGKITVDILFQSNIKPSRT